MFSLTSGLRSFASVHRISAGVAELQETAIRTSVLLSALNMRRRCVGVEAFSATRLRIFSHVERARFSRTSGGVDGLPACRYNLEIVFIAFSSKNSATLHSKGVSNLRLPLTSRRSTLSTILGNLVVRVCLRRSVCDVPVREERIRDTGSRTTGLRYLASRADCRNPR